MRRYASLCVVMRRYASLCVVMRRYASLCVVMRRKATLSDAPRRIPPSRPRFGLWALAFVPLSHSALRTRPSAFARPAFSQKKSNVGQRGTMRDKLGNFCRFAPLGTTWSHPCPASVPHSEFQGPAPRTPCHESSMHCISQFIIFQMSCSGLDEFPACLLFPALNRSSAVALAKADQPLAKLYTAFSVCQMTPRARSYTGGMTGARVSSDPFFKQPGPHGGWTASKEVLK
jgi:hypothetical protein